MQENEMVEVYFVRFGLNTDWKEVTKEEWIQWERSAGFSPKMASDDPRYMQVCATGGFSGRNIEGKIEHQHPHIRAYNAAQRVGLTIYVIDLVVAARNFWAIHGDGSEESVALDKALEKFAEAVPYDEY